VYAAFQDLVGQHGLVCNLPERSVWCRVPDDEQGKQAAPDDSAQLRSFFGVVPWAYSERVP
jgi:hypothetical protein